MDKKIFLIIFLKEKKKNTKKHFLSYVQLSQSSMSSIHLKIQIFWKAYIYIYI